MSIQLVDEELLSKTISSAASAQRKSIAYAPSVEESRDPPRSLKVDGQQRHARCAGARSVLADRRMPASEDDENLGSQLQRQSLIGERTNILLIWRMHLYTAAI